MNEPIMLAFFIWALVFLDEFLRSIFPPRSELGARPSRMRPERALESCGIVMAGGALTRYDGWFLGAVLGVLLVWLFAAWWRRNPDRRKRRAMAKSFVEVLLLNALVPVFWLIYTRGVSGYALDFMNGPYSAKAIALRTTATGRATVSGTDMTCLRLRCTS